jgi:hypothetical protein
LARKGQAATSARRLNGRPRGARTRFGCLHLGQDRERQALGTAAPEQVAGLTEVCAGDGKVVCLSLVEAELAKLLDAPTEDLVLLSANSRLFGAAGPVDIPSIGRWTIRTSARNGRATAVSTGRISPPGPSALFNVHAGSGPLLRRCRISRRTRRPSRLHTVASNVARSGGLDPATGAGA